MEININNKKIELRQTIRTYIIFESIAGKSPDKIENTLDTLTLMYATIVGSAKDTTITFDQFLDYVDEHPESITEFTKFLLGNAEYTNQLTYEEEGKDPKKEAEASE